MKPNLNFRVLGWGGNQLVDKVEIFGTDHKGQEVSQIVTFPGLVTIEEIHIIIAKMNNGQFRA